MTLHGGIAPAPRALAALRLEEREEISRGIAAGQSIRQIAHGLRRAPSTVSRDQAQRRQPTLPCQPGGQECVGTGAASQALSPGAPQGATMACGAEARAAMVTGADLWMAEAGGPDRPRDANISRSDLSQSLRSDARRAEKGADGAIAHQTSDAPPQKPQRRQRTAQLLRQFADVLGKRSNNRRRVLARKLDQHRKAAVALNQCGKVTFSPERTIRTSPNGLVRQYFPRGTNFSRISQAYLNAIAVRLNQRPRVDGDTSSIWSPSASGPPRPEDRAVPGHCCTDRLNSHLLTGLYASVTKAPRMIEAV